MKNKPQGPDWLDTLDENWIKTGKDKERKQEGSMSSPDIQIIHLSDEELNSSNKPNNQARLTAKPSSAIKTLAKNTDVDEQRLTRRLTVPMVKSPARAVTNKTLPLTNEPPIARIQTIGGDADSAKVTREYAPSAKAVVPGKGPSRPLIPATIIPEPPEAEAPVMEAPPPPPPAAHLLEAKRRIETQSAGNPVLDLGLYIMTEPNSLAAEQYRVLALKLREQSGMRLVAISSPSKENCSSLVASNLAVALSEGERSNVLLLDANLSHPEINGIFGLNMEAGLQEQLRQQIRHPEKPWQVLELSRSFHLLLAIGSDAKEQNPAALLSSEVFADLMRELRRTYDYVILSAPPILFSADISLMQDYIDGSILVVHAGFTEGEALNASLTLLGQTKFIGTVLVDISPR